MVIGDIVRGILGENTEYIMLYWGQDEIGGGYNGTAWLSTTYLQDGRVTFGKGLFTEVRDDVTEEERKQYIERLRKTKTI